MFELSTPRLSLFQHGTDRTGLIQLGEMPQMRSTPRNSGPKPTYRKVRRCEPYSPRFITAPRQTKRITVSWISQSHILRLPSQRNDGCSNCTGFSLPLANAFRGI